MLKEGEVTPNITKEEYRERRENLILQAFKYSRNNKHSQNHILIFPSASKLFMTYHVPYPFRQNTSFSYLCGFLEPNSVLVIHNKYSSLECHSVLFVPKSDPHDEVWDGPRSGLSGALELTGIDETHNSEYLEDYLEKYIKQTSISNYALWYDTSKHSSHALSSTLENFVKSGRHEYLEVPTGILHNLQVVKSPSEISLMKKSGEAASEAFCEVMKFSHPAVSISILYRIQYSGLSEISPSSEYLVFYTEFSTVD